MSKEKRTTPPPFVDVLSILPELAGREKTTVRLHPRRLPAKQKLPRDASKLGGDFLWPASEPWPVCERHQIPFVGVLQLRADEFPEVEFRKGTNLLQFLWCPQEDHAGPGTLPEPTAVWRRRSSVRKPLTTIPRPRLRSEKDDETEDRNCELRMRHYDLEMFDAYPDHMRDRLKRGRQRGDKLPKELFDLFRTHPRQFDKVQERAREIAGELRAQMIIPRYADKRYFPRPCQLFPERVIEYPPIDSREMYKALGEWDLSAELDLDDRLSDVHFQGADAGVDLYGCELCAADGTKVGGYVSWIQGDQTPRCQCGRTMEHLLTLNSNECDAANWRRWLAREDRRVSNNSGKAWDRVTRPSGMMLGDCGSMYLFICRRCKDWPIRSLMQCS